ncbi:BREX-1 system adenine-specific DNA-methyltransferase PglX [Micromonospora sp. 4G57]|uniref:site-specific DNA-methyltransferase (adenine-specific) n=1 Tax=Micromonospora sicca TaxID=2202420 RepID=A0ABU5JJH2_9ACTN|nr:MULTISPECIES: BREX-1 system adenine-specific DNA-methyltransferase PglX [unclassified Micromonospora]MDZ5446078.1 BREX-1 system adenine-specific DNA-methyltransferase PglX [Micromonospora sp. 4G57]MDZ5492789.1 BREX-1 system adenine-specific DNA-methyltransferase PglX [Micromonospora sp. 4G53]
METAPLKSFATWARTALIREVAARIAVVLAPASPERVELPNAVAALEKAVKASGGGDAGRAAMADKVAYTWFNRIIALRFMDANGYSGIGVVSPERGREGGQPEVLAEAKRGNIDNSVVTNKRTAETITSLLDGTRRSDDPQGEAYALLLAEYCRYWNRSMPFMFEREGDFTELLIPANLLADDSVMARAVTVLTEEVCQDVEVIGWLYQFYISERKAEVFAGFKRNKKAGAVEIPAATQLFTPHWIVRYLLENSLGRLWLLNRPTSRLADQMDYYIAPADEETDYPKVASPEELKIIDPACGSGHMLTYAFDLLYAIYEEEGYAPSDIPRLILTNNLFGTEVDPRAGALAALALTMKARSRQRTFFNKKVEPNICVLEPSSFTPGELDLLVTPDGDRAAEEAFWNQFRHADTFGSLIRPSEALIEPLRKHLTEIEPSDGDLISSEVFVRASRVIAQAKQLSRSYDIVVANPPYMGSGNMDSRLAALAKRDYAASKMDLYAMFIERSLDLAHTAGFVAMVTMDSWMFLGAYSRYRNSLLKGSRISTLAHLGTGAFETIGGEVVSTVAFAAQAALAGSSRSTFIRAVDAEGSEKADAIVGARQGRRPDLTWVRGVSEFLDVPNTPVIYWASENEIAALRQGPYLGDLLQAREGLTTGDNDRFLRRWYEVSLADIGFGNESTEESIKSGATWFPYQKGGSSRRWYGNFDYVVDWEDDGARCRRNVDPLTGRVRSHNYNGAFAFRRGLAWSSISGDGFAVRHVDGGFMFDTKGPMAFANREEELLVLEGFMNSSTATRFMRLLAPRLDFKLGHVLSLPIRVRGSSEVEKLVEFCVAEARWEWDMHELSVDFARSPILGLATTAEEAVDRALRNANEHMTRLADAEEAIDHYFATAYLGSQRLREAVVRRPPQAERASRVHAAIEDLVSYAVGCMFGRYSLDEPGLILANQGDTLQDYLAKVPNPSFRPDRDNVIPIVDGDWFEDDIVARFRQFLRAAFGERHFEENLRFVTEALGVEDLRDYFVKSFYKDHVQRYKKRPIYWLFSSPKGSFNALIYMHRYTPSTVSTVLNEYLREFRAKLEASRQHHERLAVGTGKPREKAAAQKEVDRLRKVLLELGEYEHDVLYPLATQQVRIDLDDGVKANYPKLGAALKKIPGLEASDE